MNAEHAMAGSAHGGTDQPPLRQGARRRALGNLVTAPTALALALLAQTACAPTPTAGDAMPTPPHTPKPTAQTIPRPTPQPARYLTAHSLDPAAVARISRFRSGAGHDFSDDAETCRSMKHYLVPRDGIAAADLVIRAPAAGVIDGLDPEWAGIKVTLAPDAAPDERVVIFHVATRAGLAIGDRVAPGDVLGHHATLETWSDVAIEDRAHGGYRLVSAFERLSDALWAEWQARGITDRAALIIPRAERDARPLACAAPHGPFDAPDGPGDWVVLQGP